MVQYIDNLIDLFGNRLFNRQIDWFIRRDIGRKSDKYRYTVYLDRHSMMMMFLNEQLL